MADIPLVAVQKTGAAHVETPEFVASTSIRDFYQYWKSELPKVDKQIREFEHLPPQEKNKVAQAIRKRFDDDFWGLRPYGNDAWGVLAKKVPADMSKTFAFLDSQTTNNPESSRLWKMQSLLQDRLIVGDTAKISPEKLWELPRSQSTIKEVQRLWAEVKPKIEQLLADPRMVEGLRNLEDTEKYLKSPIRYLVEHWDDLQKPGFKIPAGAVPDMGDLLSGIETKRK